MLYHEKINQLLGITESYKAPEKMFQLLMDDSSRENLFQEFLAIESDLSYEWFQNYFESEHADRKVKKQDYTPTSVSILGAMIIGESNQYFESAAGTGGMAIQAWNTQKDRFFILEELSDRSLPFLLFNMAIRGVNGIVRHGDSLKQEFSEEYRLINNGQFSLIERKLI